METSYEEIQKDLEASPKKNPQPEQKNSGIPEDDVTGFCLWLKNELSNYASKVTLSKRLKD